MGQAAEQPAVAAANGRGKGKLLMLVGAAVILLGGGGGAAAWWFGLFGGATPAAAEAPAEGGEPHATAAAAGHDSGGQGTAASSRAVAFVDLPDVVVNLQPANGRMRFLKLRISLEVLGDRTAEEVRALTPRILDSFQLYLRALTVDEVSGAVGMQRLKEEMLARVHRAIEPVRIEDVLIKEMLVQ